MIMIFLSVIIEFEHIIFWSPHFLGLHSYFNNSGEDYSPQYKFMGLENNLSSLIFWESNKLLAFMN